MPKVLSTNYVDTPIPGVTSLALARGLVNYGADWKVKKNVPGEVTFINITGPIGTSETSKVAVSDVADIYKNTGINPRQYGPNRKGISLFTQLAETWTVTDSVDPTYNVLLPVTAHLVLKVPNNEMITPELAIALVGRLVSTLFETGSTDKKRLASLLRGSLIPSDL